MNEFLQNDGFYSLRIHRGYSLVNYSISLEMQQEAPPILLIDLSFAVDDFDNLLK